jgi:hypothetical protein
LIDVEYKVVGSDEVEHISLSADDGALFIAQWEYEQSAVAMTNNNSDSYTEDETGGYVLTNINDERVGNDSYAIVNDYVRMTAVEKSGYEFSGWYDEKGNRLSENRVYEYAVRSSNKVYARFTSLIESYVSFVAESDNIELDDEDTPFENGSHIINTTTNQELSITGGENGYGNTISTGFVATTRFTGNVTNCIWRVTIHPDDTYVKVPFGASEMPYDFELSETPVLTDSEDVKVKRGAIYEVQGEDKSVYIFNDAMPVTISGNGTVEATYSLILDNIYAPYATAVMQFGTVGDDATDATSDDSNIFHVGEDEEFKTHSNNPYHTTNNNQKEKISE